MYDDVCLHSCPSSSQISNSEDLDCSIHVKSQAVQLSVVSFVRCNRLSQHSFGHPETPRVSGR